jgi:tRNA 2-selenouridine synthase
MRFVGVKEFLLPRHSIPLVDVRSPGEYAEGHIHGAVNLPLFDDEERARVGTSYVKSGRTDAIDLGLEIVGPKLNTLAKKAKTLAKDGKLNIHCWRGGMRSEKMAWLFELVGIQTAVLQGGYKSYRQTLLEDFGNKDRLIVLQGPTGSGKTKILHELEKLGEQILDLEYRANHKGSAFGALGMGDQPTTAQFQNDLYEDLLNLDSSKRIWTESESLSVGKVYLPQTLWDRMNHAVVIEIDLDKTIRAERIVAEYGHIEKELLAESIEKIRNRFGGDRVKKSIDLLNQGRMQDVTMLLLDYYDKSYTFSKNKYKEKEVAVLKSKTGDPKKNALELQKIANDFNL